MSIGTDVEAGIKEAMRARDAARLSALRNLKAALGNELISLKRASSEDLSDEEVLSVIRRLAKQRKDSIEQFRKGGREELAREEEAELNVLESYLPTAMSDEEIRAIAEAKMAALGVTDKSKMGQLIGAVMKEVKGRADGAAVKAVVEKLLGR